MHRWVCVHYYHMAFNMLARVAVILAGSPICPNICHNTGLNLLAACDEQCAQIDQSLVQHLFSMPACWQAESQAGRKATQIVSARLTCSTCIAASACKQSITIAAVHQEVIEISSESRRDVQGAAAGASCLDFRVPGGSRAGSKQVFLTLFVLQPCLFLVLA